MKPFRVYKANSQNTGSAGSFDINLEKQSLFLDLAKQKDEKTFDWANKLTIKISTMESAKIGVFYKNPVNELTLFHDPSKGEYQTDFQNAVLKITKTNNQYSFRLSQKEKTGELKSISINLNEEEMYTLILLLNKFIEQIHFN